MQTAKQARPALMWYVTERRGGPDIAGPFAHFEQAKEFRDDIALEVRLAPSCPKPPRRRSVLTPRTARARKKP